MRKLMARTGFLFALLAIAAGRLQAQGLDVKDLMTVDLAGTGEREVLMLTVEYDPGVSEPIHRHNAQVFVYVLEGTVVMQVKGKDAASLGPGGTFYEGLDDVHLVGRNASTTSKAKFLVFLVKTKGAPVAVPAE